ncbi:hypothetical protein BKA70DRAFT_1357162 [Coprinopsis sp. MPI-PUGE-AT-0042]|nr:hypothetical protein BKA70DRAFT_1357162 [Coprinopsis sp. MPI-PUGE-AT-0042]
MIHRCYHIWNGSFIAILPSLVLLAANIGASTAAVVLRLLQYQSLFLSVNTLAASLHLSLSVWTAGAVIFRIWAAHLELEILRGIGQPRRPSHLNLPRVIRVSIESAFPFVMQQTLFLILFLLGSPLQMVFLGPLVQTAGVIILFPLIRARLEAMSTSSVAGSVQIRFNSLHAAQTRLASLETATIEAPCQLCGYATVTCVGEASDMLASSATDSNTDSNATSTNT